MKKAKRLVAVLLVLAMVFGLAACGPSGNGGNNAAPVNNAAENNTNNAPSAPQPVYGGVLRMHCPSTATALCNLIKSVGHGFIAGCVEALGKRDFITQEISPWLADSWTFDDKTNTVTVKLHQGVKFHDGSDFNAEVVKWCNDLAKKNNRLSTAHNFETEVVDNYTVKIIFDQFYLDWEQCALTSVNYYSKEAYEKNGEEWFLSNPVGTGAFKFVEYIPNQKVVYEKNENYWRKDANGNQLPYLDGYEAVIITDQNAGMTAFINGEIDHLVGTDEAVIQQLIGNGFPNKCYVLPDSTTTFEVYANTVIKENNPWADLNVRKAVFLYGIDWEDLTVLAGGKSAICTHSISLENTLMYDPTFNDAYKYDLEKAKKMLADAGYPNGFDTELMTTAISKPCATVLQEKLKALGINANVTQVGGGDAKRYDPSIPGIEMWATTTNWDVTLRPLGSMHSPLDLGGSKTQGPVVKVDFSQEYRDLYAKTAAAKTLEERADWGKKALRQLYIEDVNSTLCYVKANAQFYSDKVHDAELEFNWSSPEVAWKEK